MNGLFDIRLRRSLQVKTFRDRELELLTGGRLPSRTIPARTTLPVVDVETDALLVLTPWGQKLRISASTCRESAYIPRSR